ncbi:MAG TPA: hypothetical protein VK858_04825 [Longimicrobiales bacterium]|nr:hypothetical protein [Longimicrobiales bacterium]
MKNARSKLWILGLIGAVGCQASPDGEAVAFAADGNGPADRAVSTVAPPDGASASDVRLRRLWTSSYRTFRFSSMSPDGRYLSMVDWSSIDLAVQDLSTGDLHRLTNAPRGPDIPYQGVAGSLFSSHGDQVLLVWQRVPNVELHVLDFEPTADGSPRPAEPTILFDNPEFEPYVPFDWSPDGERILAKVWMGGQENHTHTVTHLAFISTSDGSFQALRSFDWREPLQAAFSPDGRYVAYDFQREDGSPDRDIIVVTSDGDEERVVVDGPGVDRLLDWHPNGDLLFHSDRGGSPGVWRMPMHEGRPTGPAVLLRGDMWSVQPLGSGPGSFYYGVDVNPPTLRSGTLDFDVGAVTSPSAPLVDPSRMEVMGWAWSPDGGQLAFSASRPGTSGSVLGIVSAGGAEPQIVRLELQATDRIRWDPEGTSLVLGTSDDKARPGLYRVDLQTGAFSMLMRTDGVTPGHFALSADGGTVYLGVPTPDRTSDGWLGLVAHDLATGEERRLGEIGWPGRIEISPDGTTLAAVVHDLDRGPNAGSMGTIPLEGGPARVLFRAPKESYPAGFAWTPDGASILLLTDESTSYAAGAEVTLWRVDAAEGGGEVVHLSEHVDPKGLAVHPDGRRIAFRSGEPRGEVWAMEGLDGAGNSVSDQSGSQEDR